jgi:hypothetical protein
MFYPRRRETLLSTETLHAVKIDSKSVEIQRAHSAGLLDVQKILSTDTGISRQTEVIHSVIT